MSMQRVVIEPGQTWCGRQRAHPWLVEVRRLTPQAVEFTVLARGAKGASRVRGRFERQRMRREKFLSQFALLQEVAA